MDIAVIWPLCKDIVIIGDAIYHQMGSIPYYVGLALHALGHSPSLYVTHAADDQDWVDEHIRSLQHTSIYSPQTLTVQLEYDPNNINKRKQKISYTPHTICYDHIADGIDAYDTIVMWPLFYYDIDPALFEKLSHKRIVLGNFGMFTYPVDGMMTKQYPERARTLLQYVDYLFLDEDEILFLTEKFSLDDAIHSLESIVPHIIVTRWSQGSVLHIRGKRYHIPAFIPENIVDTTGAGDTYLAAFLAKEQETDDYNSIGRFAAMATTCKIEKTGPLVTPKDSIEKRLLDYNL